MSRKRPSVVLAVAAAAETAVPHAPPEWRMAPLEELVESPTNPRKTFKDLDRMAESIKAHGVLQDLLVRPLPTANGDPVKYEIVCGARRFRGALLARKAGAQVDGVPIRIRCLTDREVCEIQTIENVQRQDVHPLEEAEGYRRLLDLAGADYDVPTLARKVGKSESYIYQRLQLTRLIESLQKLFWAEKINIGHATILCRLSAADQKDLGKEVEDRYHTPSVRDLQETVEREYLLNLHSQPFPKDDPELVPAAGACTACPKRTGANLSLWGEIDKDVCSDRKCFGAKVAAYVERQGKELTGKGVDFVQVSTGYSYHGDPERKKSAAKYFSGDFQELSKKEAKSLPPEEVETALVIEGDRPGRVVQIRVTKSGGQSSPNPDNDADRKRKANALLQTRIHTAILDATLAAIDAAPDAYIVLREYAAEVANWFYDAKKLCVRHGWTKPAEVKSQDNWTCKAVTEAIASMPPVELYRLIQECALLPAVPVSQWSTCTLDEDLVSAARLRGVDARAIAARMKAEEKQKAKGKAKKGRKAKAVPETDAVDEVDDDELEE